MTGGTIPRVRCSPIPGWTTGNPVPQNPMLTHPPLDDGKVDPGAPAVAEAGTRVARYVPRSSQTKGNTALHWKSFQYPMSP